MQDPSTVDGLTRRNNKVVEILDYFNASLIFNRETYPGELGIGFSIDTTVILWDVNNHAQLSFLFIPGREEAASRTPTDYTRQSRP